MQSDAEALFKQCSKRRAPAPASGPHPAHQRAAYDVIEYIIIASPPGLSYPNLIAGRGPAPAPKADQWRKRGGTRSPGSPFPPSYMQAENRPKLRDKPSRTPAFVTRGGVPISLTICRASFCVPASIKAIFGGPKHDDLLTNYIIGGRRLTQSRV